MNDLDALRGIVSDLESKLARLSVPSSNPAPSATAASTVAPYWTVVMGTGLTLAFDSMAKTNPIADWDLEFDDGALADRVGFKIATAAGEIPTFGTHGLPLQKRYSIQWDSSISGSVDCSLSGFYTEADDVDQPIQVKLNGDIVQLFPTPQKLSLSFKEGRNRLSICMDERPILLTFAAALFGFDGAAWVALP